MSRVPGWVPCRGKMASTKPQWCKAIRKCIRLRWDKNIKDAGDENRDGGSRGEESRSILYTCERWKALVPRLRMDFARFSSGEKVARKEAARTATCEFRKRFRNISHPPPYRKRSARNHERKGKNRKRFSGRRLNNCLWNYNSFHERNLFQSGIFKCRSAGDLRELLRSGRGTGQAVILHPVTSNGKITFRTERDAARSGDLDRIKK